MHVELHREDLVRLLRGISPVYELTETPMVKPYGRFVGGHVDEWRWDVHLLQNLSEKELYDIYMQCKQRLT
jgi:hypothetical protein